MFSKFGVVRTFVCAVCKVFRMLRTMIHIRIFEVFFPEWKDPGLFPGLGDLGLFPGLGDLGLFPLTEAGLLHRCICRRCSS